MADKPNDPLLSITRVILQIMQGLLIFGGVIILLVLPFLWIKREAVLLEFAKEVGTGVPGTDILLAVSAMMIGGFIMLVIGYAFIKRMIAMIRTVEFGTPFIPDNAKRLREMGWLVVATQGIALLAMPVGAWIVSRLPKDNDLNVHISIEALLTAALLFILARVFDHGTRLSEDVEGTV
jgi:Protein of unknown function (DUF2975)